MPEGAFLAELAEWAGQEVQGRATRRRPARSSTALEGAAYVVAKVEQKDRQEKPPPPFTTSTLQQQASIRLHFSAKKTMMVAQRLYEGVELGSEGSVALITYMRTDSTRVADEALKACREHIDKQFGAAVPAGPAQPLCLRQGCPGGPRSDPARPTWPTRRSAWPRSCRRTSCGCTR